MIINQLQNQTQICYHRQQSMHITLHDESTTPGFIFYQSMNHFLFQSQPKLLQHQHILSINRLTGKCDQISQQIFFDILKEQGYEKKHVWAIYGLVTVEQTPYLALVKQVRKVSSNRQNHVFQILNLMFICFDPHKRQSQSQNKILDFINSDLINQKFYFSYSEDLTVSFRRKVKKIVDDGPEPKFYWNQKNTQFLTSNNIRNPWITPIIQGYVGSISENNLQFRIIARRSKYMSGTRFNNRGINSKGFASNFVQIQQRICFKSWIFSQLTLRGSVPIFWKQHNNISSIQFPQNQQKDLKGLRRHYDELISQYQCAINTVNLLSHQKHNESILSVRFQQALLKYSKNFYFQFDFNKRADIIHENIDQFIKAYQKQQSANNFQCYDCSTDDKINQQHFIPRVNCFDCIDRTNVICSRIGQAFVRNVMEILEFNMTSDFHQRYLEHWANLGNKISQLYSGRNSVAEHLTLKKQLSYWSKLTSTMKSVDRFISTSQNDAFKQQCMQYLLNEHKNTRTQYFIDHIAGPHINPSLYCVFHDVKVTVITWNVAAIQAQLITQNEKMIFCQEIFGANHLQPPQIVFVTLQEIVQLNSYNVVTNDNQQAKIKWSKIFLSVLNNFNNKDQGFAYNLYFSQALVGITSFLFVKNSFDPRVDVLNKIRKMFSYQVKRGLGGNLGNKGSIVSGFYIYDSIFINFASHFAAGDQNKKQRLQDVKAVLSSLNKQEVYSKAQKSCDFMFFAGDLNFRLGASEQQVREMLAEAKRWTTYKSVKKTDVKADWKQERDKTLSKLFQRDQLVQVYTSKEKCLSHFRQPAISFLPTYRYQRNGSQHDRKRKPGWCDRIFYQGKQKSHITCTNYSSIDQIKASDHRPVIGQYVLKVKQEDKEKKLLLVDQYLIRRNNQISSIQQPKPSYNY